MSRFSSATHWREFLVPLMSRFVLRRLQQPEEIAHRRQREERSRIISRRLWDPPSASPHEREGRSREIRARARTRRQRRGW